MKKWIVSFDNIEVINVLKQMNILNYIPLFYQRCKFVLIETDMSKEDILKISGITDCREERIFHLV